MCSMNFFQTIIQIDRELPYRMLTINGAPKKYYNLIAQLKEEYSLTDWIEITFNALL